MQTHIALESIDGGVRVKTTEHGHIDVMQMLFNWRVVRTSLDGMIYDRGWCYAGTGPDTFTAAVLAAYAWDGADDTEPEGPWIKRIFDVPGCGPAGPAHEVKREPRRIP